MRIPYLRYTVVFLSEKPEIAVHLKMKHEFDSRTGYLNSFITLQPGEIGGEFNVGPIQVKANVNAVEFAKSFNAAGNAVGNALFSEGAQKYQNMKNEDKSNKKD